MLEAVCRRIASKERQLVSNSVVLYIVDTGNIIKLLIITSVVF